MQHFMLYFQSASCLVVEPLKKSSGMLQNFGFDSPSRQFIFNALSWAAIGIFRLDGTVMHYKL